MFIKILATSFFLLYVSPIQTYPQFQLPALPTFPPPAEIGYSKNVHSTSSHINLEQTVKEVEEMLKANPALPRLTRGEIYDLLENITKTDTTQQNNIVEQSLKNIGRDPKAVMLVKPYTPDNENGHNIEELFTKPPVTQIVGLHSQEKPLEDNTINTSDDFLSLNEIKKIPKTRVRQRKTATTTTTTTVAPTVVSNSPPVPHFIQKTRRRKPTTTTTTSTSTTTTSTTTTTTTASPDSPQPFKTRRPLRRRPTTVKYHNHRYPGDPTPEVTLPPLSNEGLKLITPPKFNPLAINEDLLGTENQRKEVFVHQDTISVAEAPTEKTSNVVSQSSSVSAIGVDIPDDLKDVVSSMDLDSLIKAEPSKSQYPQKYTPQIKKEKYALEDMLAAFGRHPIVSTTSTPSMPDVSNVADNLNPDMRDLLMSFGLIPNPHKFPDKPVSESLVVENYNPQLPETKPDAYVGFKPLPDDDNSRDDMRELLARFGLGRDSRKQKALPKKEAIEYQGSGSEHILSFDMIPEEYKDTIEDIGFNRRGKMIRAEALTKTQEKQHVFNPEDTQIASEEEMRKIQKLLDFVKTLEKLNGTVTEDDLAQIGQDNLKEFITTLNEYNKVTPLNEQDAPNPLNYENGLDKNEVKRQQNDSSSSVATTESSTTEESTSATDTGPNIKDLEESFGGQTDPPTTTSAPIETTTTLRKTGFYYLVDWNSFFDIDDQKGKRVNLRFQPTIGDPKRFLSVSIP